MKIIKIFFVQHTYGRLMKQDLRGECHNHEENGSIDGLFTGHIGVLFVRLSAAGLTAYSTAAEAAADDWEDDDEKETDHHGDREAQEVTPDLQETVEHGAVQKRLHIVN